MSKLLASYLSAECSCGKVKIDVFGSPIMHCACYCNDCQIGGLQLEALPGAAPILDPDGGTSYLLYRKDRVSIGSAEQFLRRYKIKESSPTSRVVATCCNTVMYLNFKNGHWLTMYRNRFKGEVPPLEMRTCTKSKCKDVVLPSDVPNLESHSFRFFTKLIAAWIPMLLNRCRGMAPDRSLY
jgi:Family of unknown function (DUF6151)